MPKTVPLRVATFNAAYYRAADPADFAEVMRLADIALFQEMGRKEDHRLLNSMKGWDNFVGVPRGQAIAWRAADFKLLGSGSKKISDRSRVQRGAGPSTQPVKYHIWVKLRHKASGRVFFIGNAHLTPSLYVPARFKIHNKQTNAIRRWVLAKPNNVIFGGDYNIDAKKDAKERKRQMPFKKFGKINVHSTYRALGIPKRGTHKNRHIDYVFFRRTIKRLKPVNHRVIGGFASDHRLLVAEFAVTLTRRKRRALARRS